MAAISERNSVRFPEITIEQVPEGIIEKIPEITGRIFEGISSEILTRIPKNLRLLGEISAEIYILSYSFSIAIPNGIAAEIPEIIFEGMPNRKTKRKALKHSLQKYLRSNPHSNSRRNTS